MVIARERAWVWTWDNSDVILQERPLRAGAVPRGRNTAITGGSNLLCPRQGGRLRTSLEATAVNEMTSHDGARRTDAGDGNLRPSRWHTGSKGMIGHRAQHLKPLVASSNLLFSSSPSVAHSRLCVAPNNTSTAQPCYRMRRPSCLVVVFLREGRPRVSVQSACATWQQKCIPHTDSVMAPSWHLQGRMTRRDLDSTYVENSTIKRPYTEHRIPNIISRCVPRALRASSPAVIGRPSTRREWKPLASRTGLGATGTFKLYCTPNRLRSMAKYGLHAANAFGTTEDNSWVWSCGHP